MPIPIPAESYPLLMDLINQTYLDRVEQITAAQVNDSDDIVAVAVDGRKKLACKVTNDDINVRLMGGEKAANSLKFAAPQKKKNCTKGVSCGMSCIPATRTCKKPLSPNQKAQKKSIVNSLKAKKNKTSAESPASDSASASNNKAKTKFSSSEITVKDLSDAWLSNRDANYYAWIKLSLATETNPGTINFLVARANSFKSSENKNIGQPVHDLKTIANNNDVVNSMVFSQSPTIAIKDSDRVVAAFSYKRESGGKPLYVDYLASAPSNMFSGTNPVKGAGAAAVKAMVAESIRQGKEGAIKLESLDEAIPFYKKMGFVKKGKYMHLTKEAAKQHI